MARIKNIELPNEKHTWIGLTAIYGIGPNLGKTICKDANVEATKKIKDSTEEEIAALRKEVDKHTTEGDSSTVTVSPGKIRIILIRILPET